jgi:molybdate transport system substrate-binding protein
MCARTRRLALSASLALVVSCGLSAGSAPDHELVVFAASSLVGAFDELEGRFEAAHPGVDVRIQYAGSQALRSQIEHGARADVFASADAPHVEALVERELVATTAAFATNELAIAVPRGASGPVRSAETLRDAERIVLGAANVPIGAYTERFLSRGEALYGEGYADAVLARVVSRESNVRLVLAKVALGEADAAVVYATDARTADVETIPIPPEANVRAEYVAAVLTGAREPALAREWLALLRAPEGKRSLAARGFEVESVGGSEP